jgi:transglutaminase-like putative cysteine protease
LAFFNQPTSVEEALSSRKNIQVEESEIQALSNEITKDCQTDYEKVLKIHDWVAENIYYDYDAFYDPFPARITWSVDLKNALSVADAWRAWNDVQVEN